MEESLEKLTLSLQEVIPNHQPVPQLPRTLDASDFKFSPEIEAFIAARQKYAEQTRHVSIGIY